MVAGIRHDDLALGSDRHPPRRPECALARASTAQRAHELAGLAVHADRGRRLVHEHQAALLVERNPRVVMRLLPSLRKRRSSDSERDEHCDNGTNQTPLNLV